MFHGLHRVLLPEYLPQLVSRQVFQERHARKVALRHSTLSAHQALPELRLAFL